MLAIDSSESYHEAEQPGPPFDEHTGHEDLEA